MQKLGCAILAFAAGFLSVVIFHQSAWALLHGAGVISAAQPPWPMDPIPPLGVPSLISKGFWGGLWGVLIAWLLYGTRGTRYWALWTLLGATLPPLVAILVIPPLKGLEIPPLWPRLAISSTVNAVWGLGTAALLRVLGRLRG